MFFSKNELQSIRSSLSIVLSPSCVRCLHIKPSSPFIPFKRSAQRNGLMAVKGDMPLQAPPTSHGHFCVTRVGALELALPFFEALRRRSSHWFLTLLLRIQLIVRSNGWIIERSRQANRKSWPPIFAQFLQVHHPLIYAR